MNPKPIDMFIVFIFCFKRSNETNTNFWRIVFYSKKRAPRPRSKSQPSSIDSSDQGSQLRRNASVKTTKNKPPPRQNIGNKNAPRKDLKKDLKKEVKEKLPPIENLTITTSTLNNR